MKKAYLYSGIALLLVAAGAVAVRLDSAGEVSCGASFLSLGVMMSQGVGYVGVIPSLVLGHRRGGAGGWVREQGWRLAGRRGRLAGRGRFAGCL